MGINKRTGCGRYWVCGRGRHAHFMAFDGLIVVVVYETVSFLLLRTSLLNLLAFFVFFFRFFFFPYGLFIPGFIFTVVVGLVGWVERLHVVK